MWVKTKNYSTFQSKYYPHGVILVAGKYYPENQVNITLRFFCVLPETLSQEVLKILEKILSTFVIIK